MVELSGPPTGGRRALAVTRRLTVATALWTAAPGRAAGPRRPGEVRRVYPRAPPADGCAAGRKRPARLSCRSSRPRPAASPPAAIRSGVGCGAARRPQAGPAPAWARSWAAALSGPASGPATAAGRAGRPGGPAEPARSGHQPAPGLIHTDARNWPDPRRRRAGVSGGPRARPPPPRRRQRLALAVDAAAAWATTR